MDDEAALPVNANAARSPRHALRAGEAADSAEWTVRIMDETDGDWEILARGPSSVRLIAAGTKVNLPMGFL
jgi:hypothetical protein